MKKLRVIGKNKEAHFTSPPCSHLCSVFDIIPYLVFLYFHICYVMYCVSTCPWFSALYYVQFLMILIGDDLLHYRYSTIVAVGSGSWRQEGTTRNCTKAVWRLWLSFRAVQSDVSAAAAEGSRSVMMMLNYTVLLPLSTCSQTSRIDMYTVIHKKRSTLCSTHKFHILWWILKFFTIGNMNEYFTVTYNFRT